MRFDWRQFCEQHGVRFVTTGRNVSSGHIAIKCPLCGNADPSEHMVLSENERRPYWRCWRNVEHRGSRPEFLVAKILGITYQSAQELVDGDAELIYDDEWSALKAKLLRKEQPVIKPTNREIDLPRGVVPLTDVPAAEPYLDYLYDRGYSDPLDIARRFDLHFAVTGEFGYRIVFPIRMRGKLVNVMGRDITNRSDLRYKALHRNQAGVPIDDCLYNYDEADRGGRYLWICEGPFDALKILAYTGPSHVPVAMFGMPKTQQRVLLSRLSRRFEFSILALDADALSQALRLSSELFGDIKTAHLPQGVKDIGGMSSRQVRNFVKGQLTGPSKIAS